MDRATRSRRKISPSALSFERLVTDALKSLPSWVADAMANVSVLVEDEPSVEQRAASGVDSDEDLYGLYEGVPQSQRGSWYSMVLPDRITLYRGPLERASRSRGELRRLVADTVLHEIAHHFGYSDADIERLEGGSKPSS